jgi:hypothetical protein
MKISAIALATGLVALVSVALAQGGAPSGQGSTTGDPAASSQNANPSTSGMSPMNDRRAYLSSPTLLVLRIDKRPPL